MTHQQLLAEAHRDLDNALNRIAQLKERQSFHLDSLLKTRGVRKSQPLNAAEEAKRQESERMAAEMHHMEALGWSTLEVPPELKIVLGFTGFDQSVLASPGSSARS